LVCIALAATAVQAQKRDFTVEDLFSPESAARFRVDLPVLRWLPGGKAYLRIATDRKSRRAEWTKVDVATGKASSLYDAARLEAALAGAGIDETRAGDLARQAKFEVNPAGDALLFTAGDDLWVWRIASSSLQRLTGDAGGEEQAAWSPDGKSVAFVRANDLFVVDGEGRRERRLTTDGSPDRLNGLLDWVYQEEIYGRGTFRAFWWSPDSRSLAFLQLDEGEVPRYPLVDGVAERPEVEWQRYPRPGDPLPGVKLGVVPAVGGGPRWVDLSAYAGPVLLVRVAWTPDSNEVYFQLQNRQQTWLDLLAAPRAAGKARKLLREMTPAFVSALDDGLVILADGSFLWASERTGWEHMYRYDRDGKLVAPLTEGEWEMRSILGADEKNGWAYFTGNERSAIGGDVYRVRLVGGDRERLTAERGTHRASFDDGFHAFVDSWSDAMTPMRQALVASDGKRIRMLEEPKLAALDEYRLSTPEFLQVPARDGFAMEAEIIRPPDFDPSKKYPVMMFTYGGPHAPQVNDAWGRSSGPLWYQLLAQRGVVVWICDNRTASGKGAESTWPLWKEFGKPELADIEDGLVWLRKQPWIDGDRIGITGWSYGGFMALYAMTHSQSFALGIAGGSVTDWRNYDAVYTERFLLTPQENPEGYAKSSPVNEAKNLHGKLLLVHGEIDDNVHPQNTMQMAYALQKAGKPFELMIYPKSRHGVVDEKLLWHMRETMTRFILENLVDSH
jgi:dipeptidyl-peptidase-4